MSVIYAIIKDSETSKLSKISESTYVSRYIHDSELCQFHNYATDLYTAYCSCLPRITVNDYSYLLSLNARREAVEFEDTIKKLKDKYNDQLVAYSHRFGGWTAFEWKFNDDIKFVVATNFGFGSNSYFELSIYYKDLKLAPYSKLVKYRYANFTSITSHTYEYHFEYTEWSNLMDDALNFYNAVVEKRDNQVFQWLSTHLEKMTSALEKYIDSTYCYFDNYIRETNFGSISYRQSTERIDGDDFWVAKGNKISEALLFLDNIKLLPVQVNPSKYIERICNVNRTFLPKLIEKINTLEIEIQRIDEQIAEISNKFPLSLYIKLHDKYYYSNNWYLSSNRFSMIIFLMKILRRKSNIPITQIRSDLNLLEKQIKKWEELKDKLRQLKYILNNLSENRDKIITFFNPLEEETSPKDE